MNHCQGQLLFLGLSLHIDFLLLLQSFMALILRKVFAMVLLEAGQLSNDRWIGAFWY
jgi:hypothetical protein